MGDNISSEDLTATAIDTETQRFPNCIVWHPLPPVTFFLPLVGHMGIAGSNGHIYDFTGAPFGNGRGQMMVGHVSRYLQLDSNACKGSGLDQALRVANSQYRYRMHSACCDNCHSHVAVALELAAYRGRR